MDMLEKGFRDFSQLLIARGFSDASRATAEMCKITPDFCSDRLFQQMFPIVFNIEYSKHMIRLQEAEKKKNEGADTHLIVVLRKGE